MHIIALCVVLIFWFIIVSYHRSTDYIKGAWTGDYDFMKNAELSDVQLVMIDDKDGYLIMQNENKDLIFNGPITFEKGSSFFSNIKNIFTGSDILTSNVKITSNEDLIFENEGELIWSPHELVYKNKEKVFLHLRRDIL